MKTVCKSVLLWYSPTEMFQLVTDVGRYPEFLPWCSSARVLNTDTNSADVELGIAFHGLKQSFTTRNRHVPDRQVSMQLLNGPFSQLDGDWRFTPIGDGSQRACKVEFTLSYHLDRSTLAKLVGVAFEHIASTMVDAFVKRADQVYGG